MVDVSGTQAVTVTTLPYGTDEEPPALRFGLVADGDAVSDLQVRADGIIAELGHLADGDPIPNSTANLR